MPQEPPILPADTEYVPDNKCVIMGKAVADDRACKKPVPVCHDGRLLFSNEFGYSICVLEQLLTGSQTVEQTASDKEVLRVPQVKPQDVKPQDVKPQDVMPTKAEDSW